MKNREKFVTEQERVDMFIDYWKYKKDSPADFLLHEFLDWLDIEAKEERPLPCIWCNHETYVCEGQNYGQVRCRNCMAEGPATDSKKHAIRNYNRVANAVMESEAK